MARTNWGRRTRYKGILMRSRLEATAERRVYVEVKPVITPEVVADMAPRMERIFSTYHNSDLIILSPSQDWGWVHPHEARFHKGDWYIDLERTPCWSGGRW